MYKWNNTFWNYSYRFSQDKNFLRRVVRITIEKFTKSHSPPPTWTKSFSRVPCIFIDDRLNARRNESIFRHTATSLKANESLTSGDAINGRWSGRCKDLQIKKLRTFMRSLSLSLSSSIFLFSSLFVLILSLSHSHEFLFFFFKFSHYRQSPFFPLNVAYKNSRKRRWGLAKLQRLYHPFFSLVHSFQYFLELIICRAGRWYTRSLSLSLTLTLTLSCSHFYNNSPGKLMKKITRERNARRVCMLDHLEKSQIVLFRIASSENIMIRTCINKAISERTFPRNAFHRAERITRITLQPGANASSIPRKKKTHASEMKNK